MGVQDFSGVGRCFFNDLAIFQRDYHFMSKTLGRQPSGEGAGIDVHLVPLTGDAGALRLCRGVLSGEELGRADRYRVEVAREEFVVSHAALRCLLAGYVGGLPGELEYAVGEHGKPKLAGGAQGVEFNLSHSRGWAAIAVTRVGRIGVDIEGHRGFRRADSLAKTILSARELELYGSLAQVEQETFLIRSWTLKEAVLKGMGVGLAVNPRVRWNWLGSIAIRPRWCRWGEATSRRGAGV